MCICRQINFFHTWLDQCNDTLQSLWQIRTIPAQSDSCKSENGTKETREKKRYTGKKRCMYAPIAITVQCSFCALIYHAHSFYFNLIFFFIAIEVDASFIHECDMHTAQCSLKRILVFTFCFSPARSGIFRFVSFLLCQLIKFSRLTKIFFEHMQMRAN